MYDRFNFSDSGADELEPGVTVAIAVLSYGGALVGVLGNALVMLAILCTATMRHSVADVLVFNLAVTDALVCLIPMPVLGTYFVFHWPDWTMGDATCKGVAYVVNVCSLVSVLTLVVIAVERYFAIVRNRHVVRPRVLTFTLVVVWMVSAVALVYPLVDGGVDMEVVGSGLYRVCNKMTGNEIRHGSFRRSLILKLIMGVVVQLVLLVLYARMGYTLWVWRKLPTAESTSARSVKQNRKMKSRAFCMMFAIVVLFGVCWIPYWTATFLRLDTSQGDESVVPPSAVLLPYCIAMLNSAINPVLYALLSKKYSRAYMRVLSACMARTMNRRRFSTGSGQVKRTTITSNNVSNPSMLSTS